MKLTQRYLNVFSCGNNSPQCNPLSGRESCLWTGRCCCLSRPLHTRLRTAPVHIGGHGVMKPTESHYLEKAGTQFCGSQASTLTMAAPWNPVNENHRTELVTKGNPRGEQHPQGSCLTLCRGYLDSHTMFIVKRAKKQILPFLFFCPMWSWHQHYQSPLSNHLIISVSYFILICIVSSKELTTGIFGSVITFVITWIPTAS